MRIIPSVNSTQLIDSVLTVIRLNKDSPPTMWSGPVRDFLPHFIPKVSENRSVLLMNLVSSFPPSTNLIVKGIILELGYNVDQIRPWSSELRESGKNTVDLADLLAVPFHVSKRQPHAGFTNRDAVAVGDLHDHIRSISAIVHIKVFRSIKHINGKL